MKTRGLHILSVMILMGLLGMTFTVGGGGLSYMDNILWHQDSPGSPNIEGTYETLDHFGWAVASGDFNGDGIADLAVGVPHEAIGAAGFAGAVNILYGTNDGLSSPGNQGWHQDSPGIEGGSEALDRFGSALATGYFNDDQYADLAVGVPGEDIGAINEAGAVHILYGTKNGLSATGNQMWYQDSPGIEGGSEADDRFGSALAVGDFNDDRIDDLAVGVPGEDIGATNEAGAVHILYGTKNGLSATGNQLWDQDSLVIEGGGSQERDWFGSALAAGNFDGDRYDDLAVGVPGEDVGAAHGAGAVNILYGGSTGLSAAANQLWHQDSPDIEGGSENFDQFGTPLAAGNFNGDRYDDLAVGVPSEAIGDTYKAGAVHILYGGVAGLSAAGDQLWSQGSPGTEGAYEAGDLFGWALAAGNFDDDRYDDLAVGVPSEAIGAIDKAGAVHILYGTKNGLSSTGDQLWYQDSWGIEDASEDGDWFGSALAAGNFNDDGYDDLAVGVPGEDILWRDYQDVLMLEAGAVHILYGKGGGRVKSR